MRSPCHMAQPPILGPCLLWPNAFMDQDATWYRGRPRPRWEPSCPWKGAQPPRFGPCLLWPNGWADRYVTWCKRRAHGRWAPTSSPQNGGCTPYFWPMSIVAKRSPISATTGKLLVFHNTYIGWLVSGIQFNLLSVFNKCEISNAVDMKSHCV